MLPDLTPYWHHQVSQFAVLATRSHPRPLIALLGDSITEGFAAGEFLPQYHFANRGISGDVSEAVLLRLKESILDLQPDAVFLMIGTNDIAFGYDDGQIVVHIREICARISTAIPGARLVLQSILPTRSDSTRPNERIRHLNSRLELIALEGGFSFLDLHALFADPSGELSSSHSLDGLHLNGAAYARWAEHVESRLVQIETLGRSDR
jgi:lysophospholipase L1-like esterase